VSGALDEYRALSRDSAPVGLAGGEGAHNFFMARHMIDHAGLSYVQIDAGRVGGISVARQVAGYAAARGVTYVNHTFTSHLALSGSLQPYAGLRAHEICEYPAEPKQLALEITTSRLLPDANGQVAAPDAPGLGLEVDLARLRPYLVDAEIRVSGRVLYRTPRI
jgi:L-alanine-DL-glutamate epimerase-like enolase superfamily enzyme